MQLQVAALEELPKPTHVLEKPIIAQHSNHNLGDGLEKQWIRGSSA